MYWKYFFFFFLVKTSLSLSNAEVCIAHTVTDRHTRAVLTFLYRYDESLSSLCLPPHRYVPRATFCRMTMEWITRQLFFIKDKILNSWTYLVWCILKADSSGIFCITAGTTIPANPNKWGFLPAFVGASAMAQQQTPLQSFKNILPQLKLFYWNIHIFNWAHRSMEVCPSSSRETASTGGHPVLRNLYPCSSALLGRWEPHTLGSRKQLEAVTS